jgi:uncharacterized protein YeaC (DUF1315 family)
MNLKDEAQTFHETAGQLPKELIDRMRTALEVGSWPDGQRLSKAQKETTLEAVMVWEMMHLPPEQRTGFIQQACAKDTALSDRIRLIDPYDD